MIPKEIQEVKQWTYSFSLDNLKRPKHSHYPPNGCLPYLKAVSIAKQNQLSFGFYTTLKDRYVIGDLDHIDDPTDPTTLPLALTDLLVNKGLYSEVSPSGHGIRFVAKLPSIEDKQKLNGKIFYTRTPLNNKREAQLNIAPPWLRFTGDTTEYSATTIPVITLRELDEVFALKYVDDDPLKGIKDEGVTRVTSKLEEMPKLAEMYAAIDSAPLDQNPRIRRAYEKVFKQAYSHYDFWLRIIMGVHDYALRTGNNLDCLTRIVEWSKTDEASFEGEQSVIDKWNSVKEGQVSFHTVFAIAYANVLVWPLKNTPSKAQKAANRPPTPINSEYTNFRAMVDFYDITLYHDVHSPAKMFVSGDADIMKKYFESYDTKYYYEKYRGIFSEKRLVSAFHIMSQDQGFIGLTHQHIRQHILNWMYQIRKTIDLVKLYFDTPFEDLPDAYQDNKEFQSISTVEYMFNCLKIDYLTEDTTKEKRLYYKYYKSWLMGMVRSLYWVEEIHMNNCVLLLTGKEQIRKTSHFRYMLPKFMREERIAFTTHGFATESSMRDLIKLASGNSLLVWDEIEQYLNSDTESNFKKLIDSNPTKFIDKYETVEARYKPIAMYGGTSNEREFKLSDTGSRRLFIIPVTWVDTDGLNKMCWWRIINDLKDEMGKHKGANPPWLLDSEELIYQATLHSRVTAKSSLELILREMFNFDMKYSLPRYGDTIVNCQPLRNEMFQSTKRVMDAVYQHTNGHSNVKRAQLVRVMHNLCGAWTKTTNSTRVFSQPKMRIHRGMCYYGNQHKLWVVPHKGSPFDET